ncbi:hypothetical protein FNV43_RR06890 [Rhamnella rubrinervis]|uniref:Acyl-ACP thioesterase-like C-terminal domain-containing protein n=1 Tax=Rhamnella rubrinervis TaxID=2594499 RepID=A0A8K0MLP3_9ROSA|nr:hypothetical protein FNV43_RR06890 [Rhamnella rubrinervis]
MIYWKPRGPEKNINVIDHYDQFLGRLVEAGLVFQQNFIIRSLEIGPDSKAYIGALVSLLQESALKESVLFGIPRLAKLIFELSWLDKYKSDVNPSCMCEYMMMNKKTRKISEFIEETREETQGIFRDNITGPIVSDDDGATKLRELEVDAAHHVRTECYPQSMLEIYKLSAMTLEFRQECGIHRVLQPLSAVDHTAEKRDRIELEHTIRHENQSHMILKAQSRWMPKTA